MSARLREERGFVLSMVIFAVAALSIAGTALFLVVQSENAMANTGAESSAALQLANGGLGRYMGETFGTPRDSVVYEMGGGTVTVRASKVMALGDTADIYLIRSEAQIRDRRVRDLVSRRSVQQFARLRKRPFDPIAAFAVASDNVRTNHSVVIDGSDGCTAGLPVPGIATLGANPSTLDGAISGDTTYSSRAAMLAAIGADWDFLTNPATQFDYENSMPGIWGMIAMPEDSFTTVRYTHDLTIGGLIPPSGRGILVVDGKLTLDTRYVAWHWEGVILAGSIEVRNNARAEIEGSLLTGFDDGASLRGPPLRNIEIRYNSCSVIGAASRTAIFSPLVNTRWESVD